MNIQFTVPATAFDDTFFEDMPTEVRAFLASGFSQLVTLPPESLKSLAGQVITWLDPFRTCTRHRYRRSRVRR